MSKYIIILLKIYFFDFFNVKLAIKLL